MPASVHRQCRADVYVEYVFVHVPSIASEQIGSMGYVVEVAYTSQPKK